MMLLYANPNVTAKRLNGETAIQDKKKEDGPHGSSSVFCSVEAWFI